GGWSRDRPRPDARRYRRGGHGGWRVRGWPCPCRRSDRAGCAVPCPLLGHRVRQSERDQASGLRRRDAEGRAARRGAGPVRASSDRDQRVAGRGITSGDPGGRLFGHGARAKLGKTLLEADDVLHAPALLEELNDRLQRLREEARVLAALEDVDRLAKEHLGFVVAA